MVPDKISNDPEKFKERFLGAIEINGKEKEFKYAVLLFNSREGTRYL